MIIMKSAINVSLVRRGRSVTKSFSKRSRPWLYLQQTDLLAKLNPRDYLLNQGFPIGKNAEK